MLQHFIFVERSSSKKARGNPFESHTHYIHITSEYVRSARMCIASPSADRSVLNACSTSKLNVYHAINDFASDFTECIICRQHTKTSIE